MAWSDGLRGTRHGVPKSLRPEHLDGIDPRGAARWPVAGNRRGGEAGHSYDHDRGGIRRLHP